MATSSRTIVTASSNCCCCSGEGSEIPNAAAVPYGTSLWACTPTSEGNRMMLTSFLYMSIAPGYCGGIAVRINISFSSSTVILSSMVSVWVKGAPSLGVPSFRTWDVTVRVEPLSSTSKVDNCVGIGGANPPVIPGGKIQKSRSPRTQRKTHLVEI